MIRFRMPNFLLKPRLIEKLESIKKNIHAYLRQLYENTIQFFIVYMYIINYYVTQISIV